MSAKTDQHPLKVQCPFCHTRLDLSDLPAFSEISCPKCAAPLTVPSWFQKILLEEVLCVRPGLQVFRALDPTLDREACVKLMHSASLTQCPLPDSKSPYQEKQLNAFLEIFRKMSLLVHPAIVPVCSCSAIEGAVYGVTRYIKGTTVSRPADQNELPAWPLLLKHAKTAIEALFYAAKNGLSHGHLTPANLLIDQDGSLFISDFMIAFSIGKDIASEPWTAPEVAAGQEPTCKSDLFSLGVCLYEYATGKLPCSEQQEEWRAGTLNPTPPSQLNPNLPEKFSGILLRMLALAPEDRPAGYASLIEEFNVLGKGSGRGLQRKQTHARKLLLAKSSGHPQLRLITPRKRKGSNLLNLLITVLILATVVLSGILLLRNMPVQDKLHEIGLLKNGKLNLQVIPNMDIPAEQADSQADEPEPKSEDNALQTGFHLPPEITASRPRPPDYDFKAVREQVSTYLATIPPEAIETEKERIRYLGSYKTYLLSKISKMAYSPTNPAGIRLKSGEQVSGNVTMFSNENALKVRQNGKKSSSLREIPWSELPPAEVLNMAYSYVQRNAEEIKGAKSVSQKKLEEVFDEFFYLILLADWYQESEALKKYCQEAAQLPLDGVKEKLCQYIQWPD